MSKLIYFPEYIKLDKEVKTLSDTLCERVLTRDELRHVICPNIESEYMLILGSLEYKLYETECECLRAKRKCELLQVKVNRQEAINLFEIEKKLDAEFEEYQKRLEEKMNSVNEALERKYAEKLSDQETKEFKALYRKIVKMLHPDVNPDITVAQRRMFENAVEAYKRGDLLTLRIIGEMVRNSEKHFSEDGIMETLQREKAKLEYLVKQVENEINEIKSAFPYNVKDILEDPEQTEGRKEELEAAIKGYEEMLRQYKARIDKLTGE